MFINFSDPLILPAGTPSAISCTPGNVPERINRLYGRPFEIVGEKTGIGVEWRSLDGSLLFLKAFVVLCCTHFGTICVAENENLKVVYLLINLYNYFTFLKNFMKSHTDTCSTSCIIMNCFSEIAIK